MPQLKLISSKFEDVEEDQQSYFNQLQKLKKQDEKLTTKPLTKKEIDQKINDVDLIQYALNELVKKAYQKTKIDDWYDQNGVPQLKAKGVSRIQNNLRIQIRVVQPPMVDERFDPDGKPYVEYTYEGYSTFLGIENYDIGSANSKEKFVAYRYKKMLPLSEIDLTRVKKKALTNLKTRLIKSAAGLSHTWAEIEEVTDFRITRELVIANQQRENTDYMQNKLSPHLQTAKENIRKYILEMCDNNNDIAQTYLKSKTSYYDQNGKMHEGITSTKGMTPGAIKYLFPLIKKDYDGYTQNKNGGGER